MRFLAFLLLLSGRHDEAQQRVTTAELLFPSDVNFTLLSIASDAARGNLEQARARLQSLRGALGSDYDTMEVIVRALAYASNSAANWDAGFSTFSTAQEMVGFVTALQRAFLKRQNSEVSPLAFALTPAITKSTNPLRQAMLLSINPFALNRDDKVDALLEESLRHHPEGTLYFLQAASAVGAGRFDIAERTALLAASTPAVIPAIHREAVFVAAMSQAGQSQLEGKKDKLPLAVENVRKRLTMGHLRTQHVIYMLQIAEAASQWELARQISDQLLAAQPENQQYLGSRARIEHKAGNMLAAIEYADRALAFGEQPATHEIRTAAIKALEAKLEMLAAGAAEPTSN
jgi:hypothetical protein